MKQLIIILFLCGLTSYAQDTKTETDSITVLKELEVVVAARNKITTDMKMTVSVDEYLASSDNVSFIKRGAYAWEPMLNNMSSERSVVTIDGMHVFGACTDKMDPITSYVESNNLASVEINSGQQGNRYGATVAGSIDLKRKNTAFGLDKMWGGNYQSGYEANNGQFFNLGTVRYSAQKFAADAGVSYRKAGNYYDGNGTEVKHSQYTKFNTSLGMAYKTGSLSSLRADVLFDVAKNVGFPALPMDLWLSRAVIASVSYRQLFENSFVKDWDTKVYFNAVEHYMDDTKRPENLVHMDMPGWSTTYGLVSEVTFKSEIYSGGIQMNAYDNLSVAEMRMYPHDRSKQTMFAYSWPWVTTRFAGISTNNTFLVSERSRIDFGGSLGMHYNYAKFAEFNWIFHPGAPQEKTRVLPGLHMGYRLNIDKFDFSVGGGYGQRAPSVSEGYGYYIYNSFDRYDYIGNPNLKNEVSYEVNTGVNFKGEKLDIGAKANYFLIDHYILGKILSLGSPMNYQSVGVKGYTSLDGVSLFNLSLNAAYTILPYVHLKTGLTYARGTDSQGGNLPFIRPLSYQASVHFEHHNFGFRTSLNGDLAQVNYSPEYGEDKTPSYTVWNISADRFFEIKDFRLTVQAGVENLLNEQYSTYADWGNIPRPGRNIFTSMKFNF